MIIIREAVPDEIPALARTHVQADWETYSALFGPQAYAREQVETEARWRRALQQGDTLLVACDGPHIIGLAHARGDRIGALYLLLSHRRKGIGRALLARLLRILNDQGIAEARFDVVAVNVDAMRFYERFGAYEVGRCINSSPRGETEDIVFAIPTIGPTG